MKRSADVVKKDNFQSLVMVGDISHLPLDHLSNTINAVCLGTRDFGFYFSENSGGFNRVFIISNKVRAVFSC